MEKLPKTVFISLENPGTEDEYLSTNENKNELTIEIGETKLVGEYVLKRQVEVKGTIEELREIG